MKIFLACEKYFPSIGGVQIVIQEIAERLALDQHDVSVLTSKMATRKSSKFNNVKIIEFEIRGNLSNGIHGESKKYQNFLIENTFDVLIIKAAQQWTFDLLFPVIDQIKAKIIHIPCGYSKLNDMQYRDYYDKMPEILKKIDHLIYYSKTFQDYNFAVYHKIKNLHFIPNGCSENELSSNLINTKYDESNFDHFQFISVGTPPSSKGFVFILSCFLKAKLAKPSTLFLNGDFALDLRSNISWKYLFRAMIKSILFKSLSLQESWNLSLFILKFKIHKEVIFINLNRNELIMKIAQSHLFLFASHFEYSPLVLFETVGAGTPFLSVDVGNASEIAEWTQGGSIVNLKNSPENLDQNDIILFTKEMKHSISNPKNLKLRCEAGIKQIRKNFTWDLIYKKYLEIIES